VIPHVVVVEETATTFKPVKWVHTYYHPLDVDCPNAGSEWVITFPEFVPGLIMECHPRCSRCGLEPQLTKYELVTEENVTWHDEGGTWSQVRQSVPWPETKPKLITPRGKREPHRETEPIYDDGRFDEI